MCVSRIFMLIKNDSRFYSSILLMDHTTYVCVCVCVVYGIWCVCVYVYCRCSQTYIYLEKTHKLILGQKIYWNICETVAHTYTYINSNTNCQKAIGTIEKKSKNNFLHIIMLLRSQERKYNGIIYRRCMRKIVYWRGELVNCAFLCVGEVSIYNIHDCRYLSVSVVGLCTRIIAC